MPTHRVGTKVLSPPLLRNDFYKKTVGANTFELSGMRNRDVTATIGYGNVGFDHVSSMLALAVRAIRRNYDYQSIHMPVFEPIAKDPSVEDRALFEDYIVKWLAVKPSKFSTEECLQFLESLAQVRSLRKDSKLQLVFETEKHPQLTLLHRFNATKIGRTDGSLRDNPLSLFETDIMPTQRVLEELASGLTNSRLPG